MARGAQPRSAGAMGQKSARPSVPKPQPKPVLPAKPGVSRRGTLMVRAIADGYYDHGRRRPGDVFALEFPHHYSAKWMEWVDPNTPEQFKGPNAAIAEQHDQILADKHAGGTGRRTAAVNEDDVL